MLAFHHVPFVGVNNTMDKIAWIGLGNMGVPMVRRMVSHGFEVTAFNRTQRCIDIPDATLVSSLEEAVHNTDILFLMVADGAAVQDILFENGQVAKRLKQGAVVVNMSTIGVDETHRIASELSEYNIDYVDAPVSGSVGPATNGTLVVLVGGKPEIVEHVRPILETMGKSVHHLGPIGSGAGMKLLVNAFLGATVEAASECLVLADQSGLSQADFLNVLSESAVWSPILAAKRDMWVADQYAPAFALKHMAKDLGLAAGYAAQVGVAMPSVLAAFGSYFSANNSGLQNEDMAAIAKHVQRISSNYN